MATRDEVLLAQARAMNEAVLTSKMLALVKHHGLMRYHVRQTVGPGQGVQYAPGFPDEVLVGTRILYRELKMQDKYPSAKQREWLAALEAAGADVAVWKPLDLLTGRIAREIAAVSLRTLRPTGRR